MMQKLEELPESTLPLEVERIEWSADTLRIVARGRPWWSADAPGTLGFELTGVIEARLALSPKQELFGVRAAREHPLLWDYGPVFTIFGNAPLPDPPRFFQEFYQAVAVDLGVLRDPAKYLNWERSLDEWFDFVYSRTYRLLTAPEAVAGAAVPLLEAQAAEYMVLPDPPRESGPQPGALLAVVLGASWVVCREATVAAA